MTVSLDWLTQINVNSNTTVTQVPNFNTCMCIGLFPSGSTPASWNSLLYHNYTSYAAIVADFQALITGTTTQDNRYQWILNFASEFFAQTPTPTNLYLGRIDPATTNYVTAITAITAQFSNFYAFYIADQLTAAEMTQANGVYATLTALATGDTPTLKVLFVDTADLNITSGHFLYDATHGGVGNARALLCAHSSNFVPVAGGLQSPTSLAGAAMGAFFTTLFTGGIGLKAIAWQQLNSISVDTAITGSTIGTPGGSGILGVNGNIYPSFGTAALGLFQYGLMSSSSSSTLTYLDQVIGSDYIKLNVQADLVSYIASQQSTGGVPFSDVGIQSLVTVFKNTLQRAVTQNIIQQFTNSNISFVTYANVPLADKTNRIYQGLSASLNYLGRIQRLVINVTLSL